MDVETCSKNAARASFMNQLRFLLALVSFLYFSYFFTSFCSSSPNNYLNEPKHDVDDDDNDDDDGDNKGQNSRGRNMQSEQKKHFFFLNEK
jgi:hypothetical protein